MVNITLCDDNNDMLRKLQSCVDEVGKNNNLNFNYYLYNSGESLLLDIEDGKNKSNIFILDMLMGELTGIETAREIKKYNKNAKIIFLTVSREYVFESFDVMPLNYFLKDNFNKEKFEEVLLTASNDVLMERDIFSFEVRKQIKQVNMKDIISLEVRKRIITMNCWDNKVYEFYSTLDNLEKNLSNKGFVRIHRSFMVNLDYVKEFQGSNILLSNDEVVPMGIKYSKSVKKLYSDYIMNKVILN